MAQLKITSQNVHSLLRERTELAEAARTNGALLATACIRACECSGTKVVEAYWRFFTSLDRSTVQHFIKQGLFGDNKYGGAWPKAFGQAMSTDMIRTMIDALRTMTDGGYVTETLKFLFALPPGLWHPIIEEFRVTMGWVDGEECGWSVKLWKNVYFAESLKGYQLIYDAISLLLTFGCFPLVAVQVAAPPLPPKEIKVGDIALQIAETDRKPAQFLSRLKGGGRIDDFKFLVTADATIQWWVSTSEHYLMLQQYTRDLLKSYAMPGESAISIYSATDDLEYLIVEIARLWAEIREAMDGKRTFRHWVADDCLTEMRFEIGGLGPEWTGVMNATFFYGEGGMLDLVVRLNYLHFGHVVTEDYELDYHGNFRELDCLEGSKPWLLRRYQNLLIVRELHRLATTKLSGKHVCREADDANEVGSNEVKADLPTFRRIGHLTGRVSGLPFKMSDANKLRAETIKARVPDGHTLVTSTPPLVIKREEGRKVVPRVIRIEG